MKRRDFLKISAGIIGSTTLPSFTALAASVRSDIVGVKPLSALPTHLSCNWLGGPFWGNRLQDWRLHNGAIECIRGEKTFEARTVSLITRTLSSAHAPARLQTVVQNISPEKSGFCGFLLGAGSGHLDYRGAALVQRAAGKFGGILAVMSEDGQLSFRDFSDQSKPLGFETLSRAMTPVADLSQLGPLGNRKIKLDCHIDPVGDSQFDLRLVATDVATNKELGFAVLANVSPTILQGGVSLVSSPHTGKDGTTWRFSDVATGGKKLTEHPEHELNQVMGCLHSVNQNVLKLTAQFMPIDLSHCKQATLAVREQGSSKWIEAATSDIEDGFIALFRVNNWQSNKGFDYQIRCNDSGDAPLFSGEICADPGTSKPLNIALYSCIIPTSKSLDDTTYKKFIPQEREISRFGKENILFPHVSLVNNCDTHQPDLYVFCGDQYYETFPTRYGRDGKESKLDTLYRWYLWYWTFRDSVRNKPAIILADDHDVLQGNLWGNEGKNSEMPKEEDGGFKWDKSLVRMVYRIQHGHNPDPYDATPIKYDIPVTYGEFVYGGVSFAVIEDRKFKTPPDYVTPPKETKGELLGKRQEDFLAQWKDSNSKLPKICLTASIWGSPQTDANMQPLLDYDANGYPPDGRTRAVKLVSDAKALVLAGDQHLGMVAQQGLNGFDDGATFFAGPASAAFWQRWFEGNNKLDNKFNGDPNTGNFVDTFGNKMRVLAVANPKVTHKTFDDGNESWGKFLSDNKIKSEGYGIIKVDHAKDRYHLECWPWDANPNTDKQFDGWPISIDFSGKPT